MSFLHIDMTQVVEILPPVRQELYNSIVNIMGVDVLCLGDTSSQGISNHGIYYVELN